MTTKNNIREYRKRTNLTQAQAAERLGCNVRLYQKYESGEVIPSAVSAIRLAKLLKTTVEELYSDEE